MQDINKLKKKKFLRRKVRCRARVFGTSKKPRLCVFRSLKHVYGQLIDDQNNKTLVGVSDKNLKGKKSDKAFEVGKTIAKQAAEKGIKECVFDKSGYRYHGRVKSLAEGARESGLKF